jgi:upstream activation factor subunit UAF30
MRLGIIRILINKQVVLPAERAQYSAIIDGILASSDLQTISSKQIRKSLQAELQQDISEKKVSRPPFLHIHL